MPKTLESHINKNFELNYVNNAFDYFYKPTDVSPLPTSTQ